MADWMRWRDRSLGRQLWPFVGFLLGVGGVVTLIVWRFLPRSFRPGQQPVRARADDSATGAVHYRELNPKVAFEASDWPLRPVALVYGATVILLVISAFVLVAAYPRALPDVGRSIRIAPPGPRLQTDPAGDLRRFRADEEKQLNTYYWVDKQKGVVHIPIEQAMKNLVKTGIPGFPKGPPDGEPQGQPNGQAEGRP